MSFYRAPLPLEDLRNEQRRWSYATFALAVLAILGVVVSCGLAGYVFSIQPGSATLTVSGVLPATPYTFLINSAANPITIQMPGNLNGYGTATSYAIWSLTTQQHVIQLGLGATFDGTNSRATFGGAIGDGIVFQVISSSRVAVISVNNVVFS